MKIKNGEFKTREQVTLNIADKIRNVVNPFEPKIAKDQIQILIQNQCELGLEFIADWDMFEFVLFNIFQNAVKFNLPKGKIVLLLSTDVEFSELEAESDTGLNQATL